MEQLLPRTLLLFRPDNVFLRLHTMKYFGTPMLNFETQTVLSIFALLHFIQINLLRF